MKLIALMIALVSFSTAHAHLKMGTYKGIQDNGDACQVEFKEKTFRYNIKHPLNEVVLAVFDEGLPVDLGHPTDFDISTGTIRPVKDGLVASVGFKEGASYYVLEMSHEQGHEGPHSYAVYTHNWVTGQKTQTLCLGLSFDS